MHISIDESGSFTASSSLGSWCVVAAHVVPERTRSAVEQALTRLKIGLGYRVADELKLKQVAEQAYLAFLHEISALDALLICVATDAGLATREEVAFHHRMQVEKIEENIPKLKFADGRAAHQALANRFAKLSPQLYLQIMCQYQLLAQVLNLAKLYYVQRQPATLSRFRWRVDRKDSSNSVFDRSFRELSPMILQSISIREPSIELVGADYRHFQRFELQDGPPRYLKDDYGLDIAAGYDVGKVIREDFAFVDSKLSLGVQVADLLASGVRRTLRMEFAHNDAISAALGRCMVGVAKPDPPVRLLTLGQEVTAEASVAHALRTMQKHSKGMLARR